MSNKSDGMESMMNDCESMMAKMDDMMDKMGSMVDMMDKMGSMVDMNKGKITPKPQSKPAGEVSTAPVSLATAMDEAAMKRKRMMQG